jgi:hypothetical protein
MRLITKSIIFLLSQVLICFLSYADANWRAKKSAHFTVFYREGYGKDAEQLILNLEYYRDKIRELTGNNDINGHSFITLHDAGIFPNGYYNPIFDTIGIFTYSPQKRFISSVENWYRYVGIHEYTHKMQITNTTELPEIATTLFGTPFHPNLWTPSWILEGITVYSESQASCYEGRLNDGYFSSYIKTRAKEGKFPNLNTITHLPFEYPYGEGCYLYGGRFFQYLAKKYGEDKFSAFFSTIGSSVFSYLGPIFPYFSIDKAARVTFGKPIKVLFSEWREYEEDNAREWRIEGERLTTYGCDITYPLLHQGKLYYVREYTLKTGAYNYFYATEIRAMDLNSGEDKVIVPLTSSIPTHLRIESNKLYYAIFETKRGYQGSPFLGFGLVSSLYEKDLTEGKQNFLFKEEIRAFCPISSNELLYAKDTKNSFGSSLFLFYKKEKRKKLLFNIPYLISEIIFTKEGIFVVARKNWNNWSIFKLTIEDGTLTPIIDTPFDECNISFANDILYFAANYENVYRIYAYHLKDKKLFRLTEYGYADYPIVDPNTDKLYFVGLTSKGFDIFKKELQLNEFVLPEYKKSTRPIFTPSEIQEVGYIENLKTLFPKVRLPFPIGAILIGGDAVGENYYILIPYLFANTKEGETEKLKVGLGASVVSEFFKPSIFYCSFITGELVEVRWGYPLLWRLTPGLSFSYLSLETGIYDKFKEEYVTPEISVGFRFPYWNANLAANYYISRKQSGFQARSSIRKYISRSHLIILANYDHQKKLKARSFPEINLNNLLTFEYSLPLLKIRKGLWNPNIYFEDISCALFSESAFKRKDILLGGGVELRQEVSIFLGRVKFSLRLGFGINKEGESVVYSGLKMPLPMLF